MNALRLQNAPQSVQKRIATVQEWIEQTKDSPAIVQLMDEAGSASFDFRRAYKAAFCILSANMPLKELNVEDFQEWFEMLATRHP